MTETVLLVGGGGREHAIAHALADTEAALYACAGTRNPGIAALATGFSTLDTTTPQAVVEYAEAVGATLAVVGPEAPLEAGVADALSDAGVFPFGPTAELARIETDKAYQRRFMREYDIPGCPDFETFDDQRFADDPCAVHAEGDIGGLIARFVGMSGNRDDSPRAGLKGLGHFVEQHAAGGYERGAGFLKPDRACAQQPVDIFLAVERLEAPLSTSGICRAVDPVYAADAWQRLYKLCRTQALWIVETFPAGEERVTRRRTVTIGKPGLDIVEPFGSQYAAGIVRQAFRHAVGTARPARNRTDRHHRKCPQGNEYAPQHEGVLSRASP